MTMHIEGPWLSTLGKKKAKRKFRSAEEAKMARELEADWQKLLKKHSENKKIMAITEPFKYKLTTPPGRSTTHIPSKADTVTGAVSSKQTPQYTGTKMLGIGTMHKSNAVPIFSDDEAKAISSMRR